MNQPKFANCNNIMRKSNLYNEVPSSNYDEDGLE